LSVWAIPSTLTLQVNWILSSDPSSMDLVTSLPALMVRLSVPACTVLDRLTIRMKISAHMLFEALLIILLLAPQDVTSEIFEGLPFSYCTNVCSFK
jgi:hypothetical protein